jgi:hypothetical protein
MDYPLQSVDPMAESFIYETLAETLLGPVFTLALGPTIKKELAQFNIARVSNEPAFVTFGTLAGEGKIDDELEIHKNAADTYCERQYNAKAIFLPGTTAERLGNLGLFRVQAKFICVGASRP